MLEQEEITGVTSDQGLSGSFDFAQSPTATYGEESPILREGIDLPGDMGGEVSPPVGDANSILFLLLVIYVVFLNRKRFFRRKKV